MTIHDILGKLRRVKKGRGGYTALCPAHDDHRRSLSVAEGEGGRILLKCHRGCKVDAICKALGIEVRDLFFEREPKASRTANKVVALYDYSDESGAVLYQVVRFATKDFRQRRPDDHGGWIWNLDGIRRVPYRLPELLAAPTTEQVLLVEGEKDCETARALGFVATTNPGGAGKWRDEYSEFLRGKHVVIIPDADEPGRKHAQQVAASLYGKVASLRLLEMPGCKDLSEWRERGGTREQFEELVAGAPEWTPPDGASLLAEITAFFKRYVSVTDAQAIIVALWVLHTHTFDAAEATPYLAFVSAEKGCGKTRSLEILSVVVFNPWFTGRVTTAVLVRKIHAQRPTLLLDETDAAFKGEEAYREALRSVLNSGYRHGGVSSCCAEKGTSIELRDFSVFSPKALAGIGKLPDTVADRSIPIRLKRATREENVERFRQRRTKKEAVPLYERAQAWAAQNLEALKTAEPELPEQLSDRQQDCVEPLIAIADRCGGDWPARARQAVVTLFNEGRTSDELSTGVRLLSDIRSVFDREGADRLPSAELCSLLAGIETSPWGEWKCGKALTPIQLSRLLRPFGVYPQTIRTSDRTPKGYVFESFLDAWSRYLPFDPQQPQQSNVYPAPDILSKTPQDTGVADDKNAESSLFSQGVADVAGQNPEYALKDENEGFSCPHCGARFETNLGVSAHQGRGECPNYSWDAHRLRTSRAERGA